MTDVVASKEELIEQLDPARDFGTRTYEQVVREVREGTLLITPGTTSDPVLKSAETNLIVRGSGRSVTASTRNHMTLGQLRREMKLALQQAAEERWPVLVQTLLDKAEAGEMRAMELLVQTVLGRPDVLRDEGETSILAMLMSGALQSYAASTEAHDVVDVESREV